MTKDTWAEENNARAKLWEQSNMTFAGYAATQHVPIGGTFELTPRCNLRCKMCYVRLDRDQMERQGRELTAEEWIKLGKDAIAAGTLNLLITGGEPLLRDDFEDIYIALTKMGFIITLNTNATLMNENLLKLFQKYPPTATNVTLYGASPETYSKICGSGEGFDRTIRGLEMFSKVPTELEVRTTFIQDNYGELDEIRAIANRFTKKFAINVSVFNSVRGAVSDVKNCRLMPQQIFELTKSNAEYYRNFGCDEEQHSTHSTAEKEYNFDLPPKIITCLGAKSVYWITWDGKMLPCGTFSSPYTLPLSEGFERAWKRLPELFEGITLPAKCLECEFSDGACANCPAVLQAETGSFYEVPSYICEVAKDRADRKRKFQNEFSEMLKSD